MDMEMKTRFGLFPNGCLRLAAGVLVLLAGLPLSAAGAGSPNRSPDSTAIFYGLVCLAAVLAGVGIIRWANGWRQRALKERDDEILRLVNQWTKSLQQEITERKEAQRALQASQELVLRQERLAAVGQLAAGLAHEFNNIMTIIQGHASLLMDNPDLDEESLKSLAIINDGVERTARLIKQMLAFSRKQVLQQKPLDVKETLGDTAEMLGRSLGSHVILHFDIAPDLPPILADPEMFQQIIVNLVVNARDAMSSGGQLTIRAARAAFTAADIPAHSERRPGQFIRLSVTDTGSGMDTAIVNHLFEPFFTTKGVGKGMGLGLATVHGMVNQNQGWIEVESKIGQGTTFDIYFVVTDLAPKKPADELMAREVRGGKETVMVVEDEEVLRDILREVLVNQGYHVIEAGNGLQALHLWDQNQGRVDLLLTDSAMPEGMSGEDLAAKLRQEAPRLPVILSSGYSQEMLQANQKAKSGFFFLAKPYRPTQLVQAVREALDAASQPERPVATTTQRI
jgi:signal transduction histidine kinase/ActR/RegA family two-component response regulator